MALTGSMRSSPTTRSPASSADPTSVPAAAGTSATPAWTSAVSPRGPRGGVAASGNRTEPAPPLKNTSLGLGLVVGAVVVVAVAGGAAEVPDRGNVSTPGETGSGAAVVDVPCGDLVVSLGAMSAPS